MNGKKVLCALLALIFAFVLMAVADDEPRVPTSTRTDKDIVRQDATTPAEASTGLGERIPTVLELGMAAIELDYKGRMDALKAEFTAAIDEDAREEIQQRMMQLKHDWSVALIDRTIELARERADAEAEAEAIAAKQAMLNPPVRNPQVVPRDPNAGIHVEGGAK